MNYKVITKTRKCTQLSRYSEGVTTQFEKHSYYWMYFCRQSFGNKQKAIMGEWWWVSHKAKKKVLQEAAKNNLQYLLCDWQPLFVGSSWNSSEVCGLAGLCFKLFYVQPDKTSGTVKKGKRLGTMLPMQQVYPGITSHVHVQMCNNGDPTPYFWGWAARSSC